MVSSHLDGELIDPGLAADLLAAIAAGDSQRGELAGRVSQLRDLSGFGSLDTARRVRTEVLECAATADTQFMNLESMWRAATTHLRDAAWSALAADPARWAHEFVAERIESPVVKGSHHEMAETPPLASSELLSR